MIIQHKINEHGIRERLFQLEDADYAIVTNETLRTELRQFYDKVNPVHLDILHWPDNRPSFTYNGAMPAVAYINNAIRANHDIYTKEYGDDLPAVRFVDGRHYPLLNVTLSLRKAANAEPAVAQPEPAVKPCTDVHSMTDFRPLLSTKGVLRLFPGCFYDGPDLKFVSNRHESPAKAYIRTLAMQYMMQVIIPNALLYYGLGGTTVKGIDPKFVMDALDYCMTTSKSETSKAYWEAFKADEEQYKAVKDRYNLYVVGFLSDRKTALAADHRYFLDKFLKKLDLTDTKTVRKSKNTDEVSKLLERMKTEPELKTASKRKLVEMGLSQRLALQFMKARSVKCKD